MPLTRRTLFTSLLAAPALISINRLMPLSLTPILWGDGIHDDTKALQHLINSAARSGKNEFIFPSARFYAPGVLKIPSQIQKIGGGIFLAYDSGKSALTIDNSYTRPQIIPLYLKGMVFIGVNESKDKASSAINIIKNGEVELASRFTYHKWI